MDVIDIWTGRYANALLKALRLTNEGFADRLGIAVRTVAKWNADPTLEPTPEMQQALDTVLSQAPDDARARFALILQKDVSPGATGTSTTLAVEDDISSLVAEVTASSTNEEAINQLARATASLAESHTQAPAKKMLAEVLRLHRQTQKLLRGRQRLSQKRELFRIESDLLAHACLLFGDLQQDVTADEYGAAALLYAEEAGANKAIACTARAKTMRWQERYIESADIARRGFDCSPSTPIRIQLASQEANAAALLGDATRARDAMRRAEAAAETVAADSGISAWSFPLGRQAIFALSVAIHTSDPDAALHAAATADAGWASGVPHVPATWAQIRAGAGIAHLMKGSLDGAIAEVTPMLTLAPELRVSTVTAYLKNLDRRLSTPRFENSKDAIALRQQIREFNSAALPETSLVTESK
jgi:hypothetical protein